MRKPGEWRLQRGVKGRGTEVTVILSARLVLKEIQ